MIEISKIDVKTICDNAAAVEALKLDTYELNIRLIHEVKSEQVRMHTPKTWKAN